MSIWRILFSLGGNRESQSTNIGKRAARTPSIARSATAAEWANALESINFASAQMAAANPDEPGARIYVIHVRRSRLVEVLRRWRDGGYQLRSRGKSWEARKYA